MIKPPRRGAGDPGLEVARGAGPSPTVSAKARRRALVAGCVGNLVEWYDFALYGAFAAIIARVFFPGSGADGGLAAAFGVFGVAFLARPAGALLFAHYGDRHGRRGALAAGILMMAVATAGIGMLPSPTTIGWLAPVLLIVLRIAQGVAVGGEYGGSAALVVEYARRRRRGLYGGWQYASVGLGLAGGIGAAAIMGSALSDSELVAWGWRVPFVAALPLGLIGVYVRTRLDDTPAFQVARHNGRTSRRPLVDAVRAHRAQSVIGFGIVAAVAVAFNVFFVFTPSYVATEGIASLAEVLAAALVGLVLGSLAAPAFGAVSDRRGRRPFLLGGLGSVLLASAPAAALISRGDTASMLVGYCIIGIALGALPMSAFLAELFPTRLRYSGLSVTYGLGSAMFGGTAPLVAALLAQRSGGLSAPVWYATAVAALATVLAWFAPETSDRPLDHGG